MKKKNAGIDTDGLHGQILRRKLSSSPSKDLARAADLYKAYATAMTATRDDAGGIKDKVRALNEYRESVVPIFEARPNCGQENLRSTIMEEFFSSLLTPLAKSEVPAEARKNLVVGKRNTYVGLTFSPKSYAGMLVSPGPYMHTKDSDLVLGGEYKLEISRIGGEGGATDSKLIIPAVAIECKTYIERTMLDSCAGTARRIKSAMPYCLYFVAAEYMKLEAAEPELTEIDEMYILCRATNADRLANKSQGKKMHPIDRGLITDLYRRIQKHLRATWWSPADAVARGTIINRPK